MIRYRQWCYAFAAAALRGAAWAAEEAQAGGHGGEEPAGVFSGGIFTSLFGLAMFVLLVAVLGKWAWKPILFALKRREDHIQKTIEDAEKAKQDADRSLAEYQRKLNEAKAETQAILEAGRKEAHRLAEEMKKQAMDEATGLRKKAASDIAAAKDQALREIYDEAVELSTELAGKVIKKTLNPEDHRQMIQESISQLSQRQN